MQLSTKKVLTLEAVKAIAAAAHAEARQNGWNMAICVVDDGGHLLYLERMDNTQPASVQVAQDKARTAALYRRPTKALEDAVASGRTALLKLAGATPLEGGIPLLVGTQVVGAIGVSGASASQDGQVAAAGLTALDGIE